MVIDEMFATLALNISECFYFVYLNKFIMHKLSVFCIRLVSNIISL